MPDAVILPVQYAVAVNRSGAAAADGGSVTGACVAGACGGGTSDDGGCAGGTCGGGVCGAGAGCTPCAHAPTVSSNIATPAFRLRVVTGVLTEWPCRKLRAAGVTPQNSPKSRLRGLMQNQASTNLAVRITNFCTAEVANKTLIRRARRMSCDDPGSLTPAVGWRGANSSSKQSVGCVCQVMVAVNDRSKTGSWRR